MGIVELLGRSLAAEDEAHIKSSVIMRFTRRKIYIFLKTESLSFG